MIIDFKNKIIDFCEPIFKWDPDFRVPDNQILKIGY